MFGVCYSGDRLISSVKTSSFVSVSNKKIAPWLIFIHGILTTIFRMSRSCAFKSFLSNTV